MSFDLSKINPKDYFSLAISPKTKPEILEALLMKKDLPWIKPFVCANPSTPLEAVLEILKLALKGRKRLKEELKVEGEKCREQKYGNWNNFYNLKSEMSLHIEIIAKIAENSKIPNEYLGKFAKDTSSRIRNGAALNKAMSSSLLEGLSKDRGIGIRRAVAHHLKSPTRAIDALARDLDNTVRSFVARRGDLSKKNCQILSKDGDPWVRWELAQNGKIPIEILLQMERDKSILVRAGLASNPVMPVEILERLSKERSTRIRRAIIKNPGTPKELILGMEQKRKIPKTLEGSYRERVGSNIHL